MQFARAIHCSNDNSSARAFGSMFRQLASSVPVASVFPQQFPELFSSLRKPDSDQFQKQLIVVLGQFNRIARHESHHCGIDIRSWEKNSCSNAAQIFHAMMQLDAQRQRPVIMRAR